MNNYTKRALNGLVELRKEVETRYLQHDLSMEDVDHLIKDITGEIGSLDEDHEDLKSSLENAEQERDRSYVELEEAQEELEEFQNNWFLPETYEDEMKITLLKGLFKKYTLLQLEEIEKQIAI